MELRNILITGGLGFIGINLVKYLHNLGYKVKILDNQSVGKLGNLIEANVTMYKNMVVTADVRDSVKVLESLKGIDAVVHLAAFTRVVESLENPQEVWDINVNGTLNLLVCCKLSGVKKFIYASSNAALGDHPPPFIEVLVPKPMSPMGASKAACEMMCSAYHYSYGLETVCLRFSNCYGLYSKHKTSVIAKFIKQLMAVEPLTIYGDGNQSRDFVHVTDVCQAIEHALKTDSISGVYQIASGKETTINTLVDMLLDISEIAVDIKYEKKRIGEIRKNYSNISLAKSVLAYNPKIELKQGLEELWKWYNQ